MIVLSQRYFSTTHSEVLVMVPAETWNAWEIGVLVYDPSTQTVEQADPEKARFICASGDLVTALRGALSEVARWSMPDDGKTLSLQGLVASLECFMNQARIAVDAKYPLGLTATASTV